MGIATVILSGSICVLLCYRLWGYYKQFKEWSKYRKAIDNIPGLPYNFILGNLLDILGDPAHHFVFLRNCALRFKYCIYRFWSGHVAVVHLLSPDDIEQLLSSTKHIEKSLIYHPITPWLGTGLLTSTGEKWQSRRKILTPAFHFNILQEFLHVFVEQSIKLVDKLNEEISANETNVVPLITNTTLRTICETALGTQLDSNGRRKEEYQNAIYRIGHIIFMRLTRIWLFGDTIFNLTSYSSEHAKLIKILHGFSRSVIETRKNNFSVDNLATTKGEKGEFPYKKKRLAMLDLLLSAKARGEDIDDEGIREEVDTFMFEGHDTTSMGLSFMLLNFACHKEFQDKIYDELYEIFGNSDRRPTYDELQELPYLERCIKESLRLCPSVPLISRYVREPLQTKSGYLIPADTMTHVPIFDIHRNPEIYPDPEKFDPDRFLPEAVRSRHPFAYIPFSAGPRNCIGQRFALLEIKTIICYILRNFRLEPVDTPESITLVPDLVLRAKDGIHVKFLKRKG